MSIWFTLFMIELAFSGCAPRTVVNISPILETGKTMGKNGVELSCGLMGGAEYDNPSIYIESEGVARIKYGISNRIDLAASIHSPFAFEPTDRELYEFALKHSIHASKTTNAAVKISVKIGEWYYPGGTFLLSSSPDNWVDLYMGCGIDIVRVYLIHENEKIHAIGLANILAFGGNLSILSHFFLRIEGELFPILNLPVWKGNNIIRKTFYGEFATGSVGIGVYW